MTEAIVNTSPLLYLYRIGVIGLLPRLFATIATPEAVVHELEEGKRRGYDVPNIVDYPWLQVVQPLALPSEWLALDLGPGELAVIAVALESPGRVLLLDDALARRLARAAGLTVWGTLKVLLEAKARGYLERVGPLVDRLAASGMWISQDVRERILALADEMGQ